MCTVQFTPLPDANAQDNDLLNREARPDLYALCDYLYGTPTEQRLMIAPVLASVQSPRPTINDAPVHCRLCGHLLIGSSKSFDLANCQRHTYVEERR